MGKTLATIGLILSCLFFIPFASLAGLIIGIVSLKKSKTDKTIPTRIAITSIIIGGIFTFIGLIMIAGFITGFVRNMMT